MLFTTAARLIAALTKANAEGRLDEKLKIYNMPRLLILDEIGYLPSERQGANLFFLLISRRCEHGPTILTSNQSFGAWGEVIGVVGNGFLGERAQNMNINWAGVL